MDYAKIGKFEAIALICIGIVNHIVLNMPQNILKSCKSSALLNVLFITLLVFLLLIILTKCFKHFSSSDIIDISEYLGGKPLKVTIGTLYIIFFVFMCAIILRNFAQGLKLIYFPTAPIVVILLAFLFVVAIASKFDIKTLLKCNFILVGLMLITLIFTFCTLGTDFAYQRMFPLLGNGIVETFLTGTGNIYVFSGISLLFFLPPLLKEKGDYSKIAFISMAISSILLFLSILCLLFALPFVFEVEFLSPVYLLVRVSRVGSFLRRPESLFILIWILSLMSFISIFLLFSRTILQKLLALKGSHGMNLWFVQIVLVLALIPQNVAELAFLENNVYKPFCIGLIFLLTFFILILAYFKKKKQNHKKEEKLE